MTKIGVGVGDEFPIEDKPEGAAGAGEGPDRGPRTERGGEADGCGYGPDNYEDWREWREEWRARRAEWRARRREWRRRYHEEMRTRHGEHDPYSYYWGLPRILRIVIVIALIVLTFRLVAAAPFVILGLALLAALYVAHRHHEESHYRHDAPPPPPPGGP